MNKIYVFPVTPNPRGDCVYKAVAEDGEELAAQVSSSEAWGRHDLGFGGTGSKYYKDKYAAKYPDGYQVEYIPDGSVHPVLAKFVQMRNTQNVDLAHLSKLQALDEAGVLLGKLPDTIVCVACGFTKPATWEVVDRIFIDDEDTVGVQITLSSGIYAGWCSVSLSPSSDKPSGLYCPDCYAKERQP